ncbi:Peptidyl-tRNA hydrolase [Candidatus Sulfobium mesophilum]|uniref:Peptidyl-tRNA hydrolase n=1 Tax=Candidatus Sulfobium mesophilum TaxID=2016548 RepID=A0A2U3QKD3_9BACT|nr:Peptidyl-tRNA hydrolase [Candidatus Sulfobium mesophilum]
MWLLVGLGNPGSRYAKTRHNIGFLVLEELADRQDLEFREKTDYKICDGSIEGEKIALIEPLTFMNRSGSAVRKVVDRFAIPPENIIVVHDDLDLETGRLKVRRRGSSGGHKGLESIIQCIGSSDFIRVKIGIGRDQRVPVEKFVLSRFAKEELPAVKEAISRAADSIPFIISEGIEKAMNRFNKK